MMTFYGYGKCTTCRKAKQYLMARSVRFDEVDITTTPPPVTVLKAVLQSGRYQLKDLFNRSGQRYRDLNMSQKIKGMSEAQLLTLLAREGRLVKRPVVTDGKRHTVGFNEAQFAKIWG